MPPRRKRPSDEAGEEDAPAAKKAAADPPCDVCGACERRRGVVNCVGKYDKKTGNCCNEEVWRIDTRAAADEPLGFVCDACHAKWETCTICVGCGQAYCQTCFVEDPEAKNGKAENDGLCTRWRCASCGPSVTLSSSAAAAPSPSPSPPPAEKATASDGKDLVRGLYECPFCLNLANGPVEFTCNCKRSPVYCISCVRGALNKSTTRCAHCKKELKDQMSKAQVNATLVNRIRAISGIKETAVRKRTVNASSSPKEKEKEKEKEKGKKKGKKKGDDVEEDEEEEEAEEGSGEDEEEGDDEDDGKPKKKGGLANAKAPPRRTPVPKDHFGQIYKTFPDHEELSGGPVPVGHCWPARNECFADGIHGAIVAGIVGSSKMPAVSIVMSGGYEDDVDHGDEFYYTGSGGRELKDENKRTADQSSDQVFGAGGRYNEALRNSCLHGLPVRVVRGHDPTKAKRRDGASIETSAYIPPVPEGWKRVFRYDGLYRVHACWREKSKKTGFKVCRFLFKRCDNEPAPWETRRSVTSDEPELPIPKGAPEFCELAVYEKPHKVYGGDWRRQADGNFDFVQPPLPEEDPARLALRKGTNKTGPRKERRPQLTAKEKEELASLSCAYCGGLLRAPAVTASCSCVCCLACFKLCVGFGRMSKAEVRRLATGEVKLCDKVLAAYPTAAATDPCPCDCKDCVNYWKKKRTPNPAGGGAGTGGRAQRSAAQKLPCPKCNGDARKTALDAFDPEKAAGLEDHRLRVHLEIDREKLERRIREVEDAQKAWDERKRAEGEAGPSSPSAAGPSGVAEGAE